MAGARNQFHPFHRLQGEEKEKVSMNQSQKPIPIVSAILLKRDGGELWVFLQTRWKPQTSPTYSGMIEVPAGAVESYENVYDALKREVKEETNLDVVRVIDDYHSKVVTPRTRDKAFVFKPFVCQQVLETNDGLPWIGFVFLCEVEGEVRINKDEAKDPKWVSVQELKAMIADNPETIFPLQLPVLEYFVQNFEVKKAA